MAKRGLTLRPQNTKNTIIQGATQCKKEKGRSIGMEYNKEDVSL